MMAKITFKESTGDAQSCLTDVINLDIDGFDIGKYSPPEGKETDTFVDVYVTIDNTDGKETDVVAETLENALNNQAYVDFESVTAEVRDITP
jgi:hypothetical protein